MWLSHSTANLGDLFAFRTELSSVQARQLWCFRAVDFAIRTRTFCFLLWYCFLPCGEAGMIRRDFISGGELRGSGDPVRR